MNANVKSIFGISSANAQSSKQHTESQDTQEWPLPTPPVDGTGAADRDIATTHSLQGLLPHTIAQSTEGTSCRAGLAKPSKRAADEHDHNDSQAPLFKRRRLHGFYRHALGSFGDDFSASLRSEQPPSPLFFSHSLQRQRPALPPRFSSSEAGARMLRQAHGEDGIRTVTLARGSLSDTKVPTTSIAGPRSTPETATASASPDRTERAGGSAQLLGDVGIVELLEQDGRPTFVIDVSDDANLEAGPPRVVYANPALRASPVWTDLVMGRAPDSGAQPSPKDTRGTTTGGVHYHQFKGWLMSAVQHGESLQVCLPSFFYGGIVWSCSTIRQRLRVVSASSILSDSGSGKTSAVASVNMQDAVAGKEMPSGSKLVPGSEEPTDYFGAAGNPTPEKSPAPAGTMLMGGSSGGRSPSHRHSTAYTDRLIDEVTSTSNGTFERRPDHPSLINELALGVSTAASIDPFTYSSASVTHWRNTAPPSSAEQALLLQPGGAPGPGETAARGFFDWTQLPLSDALPSHIQFARGVDWASTALGPIEHWDADLRQMCNLIMASPHPAAMYWGDDLVAIYNEAYVLLAGQKHPKLMGQSYREAWAEIWDDVKDVFASARSTGEATMKVRGIPRSLPEICGLRSITGLRY